MLENRIRFKSITDKGHLIPTMSVGNTPTYVREAEKIIILPKRQKEKGYKVVKC